MLYRLFISVNIELYLVRPYVAQLFTGVLYEVGFAAAVLYHVLEAGLFLVLRRYYLLKLRLLLGYSVKLFLLDMSTAAIINASATKPTANARIRFLFRFLTLFAITYASCSKF